MLVDVTPDIDVRRYSMPMFASPVLVPSKASKLCCELCPVSHAREMISLWHSRLPKTQRGPWMYSFRACSDDMTFAVALWNNPSARTLPGHWVELRRMAVSEDAPHCTASWFLAAMQKWFKANAPQHEKMISYQDEDVHLGTIYKAAGWQSEHRTAARTRDRSTLRPGGRTYRRTVHGVSVDSAAKTRWARYINEPLTTEEAETDGP